MKYNKNIVFAQNLNATTSFETNITIQFPVKKIVLKYISFTNNASVSTFAAVSSSLFDNEAIATFSTQVNGVNYMNFEYNYANARSINGLQRFQFNNSDGTTGSLTGSIGFALEFYPEN